MGLKEVKRQFDSPDADDKEQCDIELKKLDGECPAGGPDTGR